MNGPVPIANVVPGGMYTAQGTTVYLDTRWFEEPRPWSLRRKDMLGRNEAFMFLHKIRRVGTDDVAIGWWVQLLGPTGPGWLYLSNGVANEFFHECIT